MGHGPLADAAERAPQTRRETLAAYIALTKPRIVELLLITTVPAMLLAAQGFPPLTLRAWSTIILAECEDSI